MILNINKILLLYFKIIILYVKMNDNDEMKNNFRFNFFFFFYTYLLAFYYIVVFFFLLRLESGPLTLNL